MIANQEILGPTGYIYYMSKCEDVDVVLPGKKLMIPKDVSELDEFEETLASLFELKVK